MDRPGFFARLGLAFALFFKVLFDAALAGRLRRQLTSGEEPPEPASTASPTKAPRERESATAALQLLAALQREGRFVDFVQEDMSGLADADVGAAARMVHAGCRKVVGGWFAPEPVWPGEEGALAVVEEGFEPARIRLTGNVSGEPPFRGVLAHHGWRATKAELPTLTARADPRILAPAEVEL